ncbi:MAG: TonB-dependent receptor [Magnetococcales bacterium]|nr:TonB-dependent receptor [Magnetococcales bacterium]
MPWLVPLLLIILLTPVWAAAPLPRADTSEGVAVEVRGAVDLQLAQEGKQIPLLVQQELIRGDIITTADDGRAAILFSDQSQIKINQNSTVQIGLAPESRNNNPLLKLFKGEVWNTHPKGPPPPLRIQTPVATASIQGTKWFLSVAADGATHVTVQHGQIRLENSVGFVLVEAGQGAEARQGQAPVLIRLVRSEERSQWLYFVPESIRFLQVDARADPQLATIAHQMRLGAWQNAMSALTALPDTQRNTPLGQALEGVALTHDNRLEVALLHIRKARQQWPDAAVLAATEMHTRMVVGDLTAARQLGESARERHPRDPMIATLLKDLYLLKGDLAAADQLTAAMLEQLPDHPLTLLDRAGYLVHADQGDAEALQLLLKGRQWAPFDPDLAIALGALQRRMGEYADSHRTFAALLEQRVQRPEFYYHYGLLASQTRQLPLAHQLFVAARTLQSQITALPGDGIVLLKQGRIKEALQRLQEAVIVQPDSGENHLYLAVAFYQSGQLEAAFGALETAIRLDPNDPTPHLLRAMIHNDRNEPYLALQAARQAEPLLPRRKRGSLDLIQVTRQGLSNVGAALRALGLDYWSYKKAQDVLHVDPYDPDSHFFLGTVHANLSNPISGQSEFAQGILMDPSAMVDPNRHAPLIRQQNHYLTTSLQLGHEADGMANVETLKASGGLEVASGLEYLVQIRRSDQSYYPGANPSPIGLKENGRYDGHDLVLLLGLHPDYANDLYLRAILNRGELNEDQYSGKLALPYIVFTPGLEKTTRHVQWELGGHRRLDPLSHLLFRGYHRSQESVELGTGFLDPFDRYGAQLNRLWFFTGNRRDTAHHSRFDLEEQGVQLKHLLTLGAHQLAYGMDFLTRSLTAADQAQLLALPGPGQVEVQTVLHQVGLNLHVRDRWQWSPEWLAELGMAWQRNRLTPDLTMNPLAASLAPAVNWQSDDALRWQPRLGLVYTPNRQDTWRLAWQENRFPRDVPVAGILAESGQLEMDGMALREGIGPLENLDVAGLIPFEPTTLGLDTRYRDLSLRWEREWSGDLFHFSHVGLQDIVGVGRLGLLLNAVNYIPHPRIGFQVSHLWAGQVEYEQDPFALDLMSRQYIQSKVTYVDPDRFRAVLWHEHVTKARSHYPSVGALDGHDRVNLKLSWEDPSQRYGLDFFWFNLLNDRQNLPGLSLDDRFVHVKFSLHY